MTEVKRNTFNKRSFRLEAAVFILLQFRADKFVLQLPCVLLQYVWSRRILILIFNLLGQMRYRWNRHHSYIVNIVFLNNLVQN